MDKIEYGKKMERGVAWGKGPILVRSRPTVIREYLIALLCNLT
jgi:hypothetical protein